MSTDGERAPWTARWRAAAGLLATAALCSCATPYPLYEGPRRPDEEVALLDAQGNASILQVDGENMPHLEQLFALEPGPHVVLFRARHTALDFGSRKGSIEMGTHAPQSVTQCFVTFEMKAGHRYVVRSKIETDRSSGAFSRNMNFDSEVFVALVDETTGEAIPDLKCATKKP